MPLITNCENYYNELLDEIKLFYPDFAVKAEPHIIHSFQADGGCFIEIGGRRFSFLYGEKRGRKEDKVFNKLSMYKALCEYTGKTMPWGSLTGIRPTKLAYDMTFEGMPAEKVPSMLQSKYLVSREKAEIIGSIIGNQQGYLPDPKRYVNLYVHIPFCKSICSYCAFTTVVADKNKKLISEYADVIIREIENAKAIAAESGRRIYSVYIGGGTPTAIDDESFGKIVRAVAVPSVEFTCEAGRPDTISDEKLAIMKKYGVNRLCINPQTLNEKTLRLIGRSHTSAEFFDCFERARGNGFRINVDIIAGLPDETEADFLFSLNGAMAMSADNITVHTLALKNGAELKNNNFEHGAAGSASNMTDIAYNGLIGAGYKPYYLYRQKSMAENLENIGYCKDGAQCAYNITSMEEALPIIACGAGGISKMLFDGGRIERLANLREIRLYIEQFEKREAKKRLFFLN